MPGTTTPNAQMGGVLDPTRDLDWQNNLAVSKGMTSYGPLGGVGYSTGAGAVVTQATSKSTSVTLNGVCGTITMNGAALANATTVAFTLTNSAIAATDVVLVSIKSGGTASSYQITVGATAAGSCVIEVRNYTGGSLSEALVLNFVVFKSVAA